MMTDITELVCDLCDGTGIVFACSVHGAFISQNDVNTQKTCHLEHPLSRGRPCGEILHRNVECPGPDGNGHTKVLVWECKRPSDWGEDCTPEAVDEDRGRFGCGWVGHSLDPAKVKAGGYRRWCSAHEASIHARCHKYHHKLDPCRAQLVRVEVVAEVVT